MPDFFLWVRTPDGLKMRWRWWWSALAAVVVLALAAGFAVWRSDRAIHGLAGDARVTASSTRPGASVRELVTSGSATVPGAAWQSDNETAGAWVELRWPSAHELRRLTVVRTTLDEPGPRSGYLSFGDGSFLQFTFSTSSPATEITFGPRLVDRVRMTVSAVEPGATDVELAEILAGTERRTGDVVQDGPLDGNVAASAVVTQHPQSAASDPGALIDGTGVAGPEGVGDIWTAEQPTHSWVQLDWAAPRELVSVAVVGTRQSTARPTKLTVTFSDGAQLPVGATLADSARPTIVSFMPRVTTSVRLSVDDVEGQGPVALAEVRAYQRGAVVTPRVRAGEPVRAEAMPCAEQGAGTGSPGLVVRCPLAGSMVAGPSTGLDVFAPGYSTVAASAWPGDGRQPGGRAVQTATDPGGSARLAVDLEGIPAGPFTVKVEASRPGGPTQSAYLSLYHGSVDGAARTSSSAAVRGRTLVYAEEFEGPLSVSRSGSGADYAAAKPTHAGVEDFGDAIFADPTLGLKNVGVIDNQFLRMTVQPNPPGFTDPQGWGRTRTGGLLASARPGGSGFSTQYGYFEARMLAPAGPGTWPAFWLLPSDNLIRPQPAVAEIDAVELYGHEPTGACHSTHDYIEGRDGGVARCGRRFDDERTAMAWHDYGVSVTPTDIRFFIDGRPVAEAPQVTGGGAPMFFLVNLALGGGWPIALDAVQDRAVLYVDHIRVYV